MATSQTNETPEDQEAQDPQTQVVETGAGTASSATQVPGARGIVSAPTLVAPVGAPAVAPAPQLPIIEVEKKSNKVDFDFIDSEVERILKEVPQINRIQISGIVNYVHKCDPSQVISVEEIAAASVGLWHNLRLIICNENEYFEPIFTAALRVFELARQGALNERYMYRAYEQMKLSKEDLKAYADITTMMSHLAPVKSRAAVLATSLKLTHSLRNGLTQDGVNRVVAYFEAGK